MFPLAIDPDWYEGYWLTDRPHPARRSFARGIAGIALLIGFLVGGNVLFSSLHNGQQASTYQDWEQE